MTIPHPHFKQHYTNSICYYAHTITLRQPQYNTTKTALLLHQSGIAMHCCEQLPPTQHRNHECTKLHFILLLHCSGCVGKVVRYIQFLQFSWNLFSGSTMLIVTFRFLFGCCCYSDLKFSESKILY